MEGGRLIRFGGDEEGREPIISPICKAAFLDTAGTTSRPGLPRASRQCRRAAEQVSASLVVPVAMAFSLKRLEDRLVPPKLSYDQHAWD